MKRLINISSITILSFITLIMNGQTLEHLPVKVKTQKVEVKLHNREVIKGYLVNVEEDTVFIVMDESMVEGAIINGCKTCTKILERDIYKVKVKQSPLNRVVIGTAILGAGIIWSMGGENHNPDGISERTIRMMAFSVYGGGALVAIMLIQAIMEKGSYDLNTLKKKSSKTRFYRKCNEKIRKFILYGKLNKTYSIYTGDNFRLVKGRVVKKDAKEVAIILENSDRQILINNIDIKCIK